MKKITFLLLSMFCFIGMNAQQPTTVTEALDAGIDIFASDGPGTAVITHVGNRAGGTVTYTDRGTFQADCTGTLVLEDVGGGPGGIAGCSESITSAGDICFAAGEIVDDFEMTIGAIGSGQTTVYAEAGNFSLVNDVIGSNTFTDFSVVNLPSGTATSLFVELYSLVGGSNVDVRIFGTGGLIDTFSVNVTSTGPVTFGFIAAEPVVSVEFEDLSGANAELMGQIEFGDCVILGVTDNLLSQVSVFPNPANEVLNVSVPATVEVTGTTLYDVLGKDTGARLVNGQINTSNLARGVYILNVETNAGTITKKIVKE